ncbi:MAG: lipopolysaccharide heptosyltransferase II [Candidatus Omnitrophota bacterium]
MDIFTNNPKRILIIRTDRLGDVILSTPAIKNIRNYYPNAYLAFMCRPYTKDALNGNPYLDEIIVYDKDKRHKNFLATLWFSFTLRKYKFDLAIILHPTNRVNLLTFFSGIPRRVGWNRKLGWLLNVPIEHLKQEGTKHESEYTLDILREIGIPIVDRDLYFPIHKDAEHSIETILARHGISENDPFIVIHPSASCPSKRWPQEHFSQLVKLLKEKTKMKIVVITAEREKAYAQKIVGENSVIDLRGNLTISEVGSLLKRSRLFISNDSGPVHIAAALRIPVISIFGRSDPGLSPERWKPLGNKSIYLHKNVGCFECLAHNCTKNFLCLTSITPDNVLEKALYLLNSDKS